MLLTNTWSDEDNNRYFKALHRECVPPILPSIEIQCMKRYIRRVGTKIAILQGINEALEHDIAVVWLAPPYPKITD